jgi:capsular polysaccharide biosynthesis protein
MLSILLVGRLNTLPTFVLDEILVRGYYNRGYFCGKIVNCSALRVFAYSIATYITFTEIMGHLKDILRFYKRKIISYAKRKLINFARFVPISSKYVGSPKGYYTTSEEYWKTSKTNNLSKITYTPFLPVSVSQRNPPKSIYTKVHWLFEVLYTHTNPETFVISIPNGRVFGNHGTVITHDDKLLFDVSLEFGIGRDVEKVTTHDAFKYLKLPKCQQIPQSVAVLATAGGERYFHWLIDALPRLEILRQALPSGIEHIDKFIVNKGIPIIVESLKMLDIPLDKLIFIDSNTHIQAKSLVIPSLPGHTGLLPSWGYKFLRESFLKHKADVDSVPKLYISRSKSTYRRVTNEETVLQILSKFGFTPIWLEEHNFATQIALLSNAEVIVAPHGAGLTNLIWCNPGAKVLEIFSPNYVNVCFWAVAEEIGLEYYYLIGDGEQPADYVDPHLFQDDILVPIEELNLSLEMLLR